MEKKVCFVLMGYGEKTDLATGRKLNLDKTFEHLIKPVFDELDIICIRASDVKRSGIIDVQMYENILKADIVVADISTLNANAIYELGVRHGLRPFTTIVIAEDQLIYPFDLNHIKITHYQHLGVDIGATEVGRFQDAFKKFVSSVLDNKITDSPVYTYLNGLTPPEFTAEEKEALNDAAEKDDSISDLIKQGEEFKNKNNAKEALDAFQRAAAYAPNEPFIVQRLALLTYKLGEPSKLSALMEAEKILEQLNPDTTNDVETLGLMGAINKRLYEQSDDKVFLNKSISYYERGFVTGKDYYNGINLAYLYLLNSSLADNDNDKITDFTNARRTRKRTREICSNLIDTPNFGERVLDRVWILLTLAEIVAIDESEESAEQYVAKAKEYQATEFELSSYYEQKEKIKKLFHKIKM